MPNTEPHPVHQETYGGHKIVVSFHSGHKAPSAPGQHPHHRLFIDGREVPRLSGEPAVIAQKARRVIDQRNEDAQLLPRLIELIGTRRDSLALDSVGSVAEGDIAWVYARGRWRRGLVTKIARVRVTVSYTTDASIRRVSHKAEPPQNLRRETAPPPEDPPAPSLQLARPANELATNIVGTGPSAPTANDTPHPPEDTERVAFADLKVNDVIVRGCGDERRARVLRPAEDFTDLFGRAMRQYWCGAMDGSGKEGWVPFGPGGTTLRLLPGAVEADFRSTMDRLGRTQDAEETLIVLVRQAAQQFAAARAGERLADASEHVVVTMEAAAATSHPSTLIALGLRARQLWTDPGGTHQGAAVGCLPRDVANPAVVEALRIAREAGIALGVIPDRIRSRWSWEAEFGSDGVQGALLWSHGSSLTIEWSIDGRTDEKCLTRAQAVAARQARNQALTQVQEAFRKAGWNASVCGSTNTRTQRLVDVQVSQPRRSRVSDPVARLQIAA
ncbi:hypothetical protein ABR737_00560 [Streptomyces sp. Edi2]|uniref:hypothetical protein n=1 Tax=Streptomyces sp. Edi2 TaxID=3162528 RepID=UPI0033060AD0